MFCSFDEIFKPSPEKMAHYIDMANKDIERMLKEHGKTCITCAHYRSNNIQGFSINRRCGKTALPLFNPTSAVCCDYDFMGFLENKYKKSVDNEEEK